MTYKRRTDFNDGSIPNEWKIEAEFDNVYTDINTLPTIATGTAAPAATPTKIGDMFIDTNNKKVYVSVGISASTDWKILN